MGAFSLRLGLAGWLVLALALSAVGQLLERELRVARIEVRHVGPPAVSDALVRANIRSKVGDPYRRARVDEDIRQLYATGYFYNIQVAEEMAADGVALTYVVQGKPRLTDIQFSGNRKYSDNKLRKKLTSKRNEPLDEHKLFTDAQEIKKLYEKAGYHRTEVKYVIRVDEAAGRGSVTFEITESPKRKIVRVDFVGTEAFPQKKLRKVIKTRKRWMFSWLTGSGRFKEEQFQEDREKLATFYRERGYLDFEIRDVQIQEVSPREIVVRLVIYEGRPYKVGAVRFSGNTLFPTNELHALLRMKEGDAFTPAGLSNNAVVIENYYGSRGHIDVAQGSPNLRALRVPNIETGTMDLEYQIEAGQKSFVEKIDIRGNTKTKDQVIRRELAVSPGETFDMVRVKLSKARLEGLRYFEKVELQPEPTDIPNRRNLVVSVEERNTGSIGVGAGFSSLDALVGFAEFTQGNFDLFNPPYFTGAGQKFRLRVQLGTQRQDYQVSFIEPWFLGRKLALGVDLYHREWRFVSVDNLYDETRTGARISLTRALWSDFFIGSLSYNIESVGIDPNDALYGPEWILVPDPGRGLIPVLRPEDVPSIRAAKGYDLLSRVELSLAWDTRNSVFLPNKGQRTRLAAEIAGGPLGGDGQYYKLDLNSAWYFPGLARGHVLELVGRAGVVDTFGGGARVPFYERHYLGGLYSLRGYDYRDIGPKESYGHRLGGLDLNGRPLWVGGNLEPVGGGTYWFASAEYSIPIIERVRVAAFYDIGMVYTRPYSFDSKYFNGLREADSGFYADNWGVGLRLNLPIGPLRLDYAIPITHDETTRSSGKFQFGVGYTREF